MKSKIIKLYYLPAALSFMMLANSCELDNYGYPDAQLSASSLELLTE